MIDALNDTLISLSQASRILPNHPSPATLWRWYRKGVRGIQLETVVIGRRRYTTHEALLDFIRKNTEAANADPVIEPLHQRDAHVERRLKEAGLL